MTADLSGALKECSFCKSQIKWEALKCPNCAEWIDGKNHEKVGGIGPAVLSLFVPGLGQMVNGQVVGGFALLGITLICYFIFLPIGVFFHILVILGAFKAK